MRRKIGKRRNTIVTGLQNKVDAMISHLRYMGLCRLCYRTLVVAALRGTYSLYYVVPLRGPMHHYVTCGKQFGAS